MTAHHSTIFIHRYTLDAKVGLNAKSNRTELHGALIRVEEKDRYGYGCIQPWPELGDVDLDQTLGLLARGDYTDLSRRALQCAAVDAEARCMGVSLFDGLTIPSSHATLVMNERDFQTAEDAGFKIVKVKVGKDLTTEASFIREQAKCYPSLEWRLDFNGTQCQKGVESLLKDLGEEVRDKIDFIEDAYQLGTSPWINALGPYDIPMAVDREVEDTCGGYGVAVIKPALNVVGPILERAEEEGKRAVITSYMDHPVGQCFAAWEAARANQSHPDIIATCGLVTHGLFEPDAFTEVLGKPEPNFHPTAGTGLGFDELLESLPWKPLI